MAKNLSFTSEGMAEFGSSPNAYYTPNPPKYEVQFLLPLLAGGILDRFVNTSAYTGEALALKVLEEGSQFYSLGSNVKEKIEQEIAQALAKGDNKKAEDLSSQKAKTEELLAAAKSGAAELK